MSGPYDDIIHLPHPVSVKHPRMAVSDRAAQFSPFAALAGHDAAIRETARLTGRRIELDEDTRAELDRKLRLVEAQKECRPEVSITYFKADDTKSGGAYQTITGYIRKIDDIERKVVLTDGMGIDIDDILDIEGEGIH